MKRVRQTDGKITVPEATELLSKCEYGTLLTVGSDEQSCTVFKIEINHMSGKARRQSDGKR
jgi:hypothetical protein